MVQHNRTEGDINLSEARRDWYAVMSDPETVSYLEEDAEHFLHQSLSTPCLDVLASCEGIYLTDIQGKSYMDFHGNNVHQLGYRNPYIIEKIKEQLDILPFSPRRYSNVPAIELAKKLGSLLPGNLKRVLFAPGGTSAISMALKLARIVTGKHKVVSLWDSFHGASLDAISAGGELDFRKDMGPLMPGVERIPPPMTYRGPFAAAGNGDLAYADYLEYVIEKEGDIGAFLIETIRNTDVQIPSQAYWKKVREICTKHNVLLILDEIPIAFGRTGKMFAFEHYDIEPDIVCLGKGLGGGVMPMAAIVARDTHNIAQSVSLGHFTHEKSPLGSVAALAMLDYMEQNRILEKVQEDAVFMAAELQKLQDKFPLIGDVRGVGLLWGIELVRDKDTKEKAVKEAEIVMYECLKNGLSFKVSQGNVLQLSPPLIISRGQLREALLILENALGKASVFV
ncbi:aspartate aminotransferase family protein [Dyadobacter fanqingshengii]|uniref:Aspartate aminotransferase family protein n=1 Tax=Dyadobacter fanqingshengii TaxID=2906443 RepID=A0A9X1PG00_9BACT|nr:aspartate aminotransferase family protein [Dyadobacter fanqingshengii]MCF0043013.1 aspartate aminotransferase family protein [Dyadobacter fanqingshengii]USJ35567.1 aspartate aminotransferase family protein [Dyadobacter fanqingshengii]